jgi:C-8 sterol isomerase
MARLLMLIGLLVGLLSPLVYYIEQNLESFYIFDKEHLHDLAKRSVAANGDDTRGIVRDIVTELREKYPGHISQTEDWFFNNAGGAMGGMFIIHASITEYIIIFGTAIGTEGHTGRHTADDYFHILSGEQHAYALGDYEPEIYRAGDMHHLRRNTIKQYRMPDGCFALEYARGWIPPMMFFGLGDLLTSTLDLPTLWHTVFFTGREMVSNLLIGKI